MKTAVRKRSPDKLTVFKGAINKTTVNKAEIFKGFIFELQIFELFILIFFFHVFRPPELYFKIIVCINFISRFCFYPNSF